MAAGPAPREPPRFQSCAAIAALLLLLSLLQTCCCDEETRERVGWNSERLHRSEELEDHADERQQRFAEGRAEETWKQWLDCVFIAKDLSGKPSVRQELTAAALTDFAGITHAQALRVVQCKEEWRVACRHAGDVKEEGGHQEGQADRKSDEEAENGLGDWQAKHECGERRTRVLHVTVHGGLQMELHATLRFLPCVEVETFVFNDGHHLEGDEQGLNYNVNVLRANTVWLTYASFFQQFDVVVVSDTTPMARPFLEGSRWSKPLLLWVTNRFDWSNHDHEFTMAHEDMRNNGYFPDEAYYELMREASFRPNVHVLLSNSYEGWYASEIADVPWEEALLLRPAGLGGQPTKILGRRGHAETADKTAAAQERGMAERGAGPDWDRSRMVLLPDRGIVGGTCPNEEGKVTLFGNNEFNFGVAGWLQARGWSVFQGWYEGGEDAARYRAMVRIPNNYMTTAFHQLLSAGVVMLVPSREFLLTLSRDPRFWWSEYFDVAPHRADFHSTGGRWRCPEPLSSFDPALLECAYEYDPYHAEALTFFDSWTDLLDKLEALDVDATRERVLRFMRTHQAQSVDAWHRLLCTDSVRS